MNFLAALGLALWFFVPLWAQGREAQKVKTLTVTPDTAALERGDTTILVCTPRNKFGTVLSTGCVWRTSDSTVAKPTTTVTQTMKVRGINAGSAFVWAFVSGSGSIRDTARITVTDTTPEVPPATQCEGTATHLCPGDNLNAKVQAQPSGTAFTLDSGTYYEQEVTVKSGMSFTGPPFGADSQPVARLDGSKRLTGFVQAGAAWYAPVQVVTAVDYPDSNYTCQKNHPGCARPQQLWVGDSLYEHVTRLDSLGPGKWFLDYATNRAYLPMDPDTVTVRMSVTRRAFLGNVGGVTIKRIGVYRYATEDQQAAVNWNKGGWTIDSIEGAYNHGVAVIIGGGGRIRWSNLHHNGQASVMAFGTNPLVEGNYLHHNNTALFGPGPFGMASNKFVGTNGLIVRNNVSTHNDGPGLWTDINNVNCLYEGNRVDSNGWRGIFHEISYACVIRNNTVRGNGFDYPGPTLGAFEGAGILVSNSPNVEVYGNTVEDNRNGILGREEDREADQVSPLGPHNITNLWVHDNTVRQMAVTSAGRAAGITDTDPGANPYAPASNNRWARNRYECAAGTKWRWEQNVDVSKATWLTKQDSASTFTGC